VTGPLVIWRSVPYAAKFYGIKKDTVLHWIWRGRFASVDIPVYQDKSNRWWIAIPQDKQDSKD
jgi:hypothetical protein